jgi:hypothetical protein
MLPKSDRSVIMGESGETTSLEADGDFFLMGIFPLSAVRFEPSLQVLSQPSGALRTT